MGIKDREYDDDGIVIRINKEKEKRNRKEINIFVKELLKLSTAEYNILPINERLLDALVDGKNLTGKAYKRHLSFLVKLVNEQGFDNIYSYYQQLPNVFGNNLSRTCEITNYQNRLMNGDKTVINELLSRFADVDVQYLLQLARNSNKEESNKRKKQAEQEKNKQLFTIDTRPTKSSKRLYNYLLKLKLL